MQGGKTNHADQCKKKYLCDEKYFIHKKQCSMKKKAETLKIRLQKCNYQTFGETANP